MLDDTPRKLLRIIAQFNYHFKRMPTIRELARLSGRRPAQVLKGFQVLADQHYIDWSSGTPIESAVILETWERNVPYDNTPQRGGQSGNNTDYWLHY